MNKKKSYDRVTDEGVELKHVTVTFRKDVVSAAAKVAREQNRSRNYVLAEFAAAHAVTLGLVPKDPPRLEEMAGGS